MAKGMEPYQLYTCPPIITDEGEGVELVMTLGTLVQNKERMLEYETLSMLRQEAFDELRGISTMPCRGPTVGHDCRSPRPCCWSRQPPPSRR